MTWRPALRDGFDALPAGVPWQDGTAHGAWRAIYDGYGTTEVKRRNRGNVLVERPKTATRRNETHGSLVTTRASFDSVNMRLQMRTQRQLRTPPNPWEAAWLLWAFQDNTHFYYVILKPNGWELGKEDPAYPGAQRFLATGEKPFAVGRWHHLRVRQVDNVITVWANGKQLVTYRDVERPYSGGSVGLYTEDAKVQFRNLIVETG